MEHLNKVLTEIFGDGEFYEEKCLIVEAVEKDNAELVRNIKGRNNKDEPTSKIPRKFISM